MKNGESVPSVVKDAQGWVTFGHVKVADKKCTVVLKLPAGFRPKASTQ